MTIEAQERGECILNLKPSVRLLPIALYCGAASAVLHDRGNGFVYDDTLEITWLADANFAQTSGFDADGEVSYDDALAWLSTLNVGGYVGWRMPSANIGGSTLCTTGYNCLNSELGHLFYVTLGVQAGDPLTSSSSPALSLFHGIQPDAYWSKTEAPFTYSSWQYFYAGNGFQGGPGLYQPSFHVWAVRDGDVSPVPEPAAYLLAVVGLALVGVAAYRPK